MPKVRKDNKPRVNVSTVKNAFTIASILAAKKGGEARLGEIQSRAGWSLWKTWRSMKQMLDEGLISRRRSASGIDGRVCFTYCLADSVKERLRETSDADFEDVDELALEEDFAEFNAD